MRKEHTNLIPTYKIALYYVKIGFRILTTIITKIAFIQYIVHRGAQLRPPDDELLQFLLTFFGQCVIFTFRPSSGFP